MKSHPPAGKSRFSGTVEEAILRIGLQAVVVWLLIVIGAAWYAPRLCRGMLKAVAYHAAGGRAAGISAGLASDLPMWLVVAVPFAVDVTVVFLLYPLIIYSYKHGVRRWLLGGAVESALASARTQRRGLARYGVIGLIFFVWFPFYMTGPLIGAVIGYFLRLTPRLNLTVVSLGTLLAIISWTFLFDQLHKLLEDVATGLTNYIPLAVVALVLAVLAAVRLRAHRKHIGGSEPPPARDDRGK